MRRFTWYFKVVAFRLVGKGPVAYDRERSSEYLKTSGASVRISMKPTLILASASPRRRQLLAEAGYAFEVDPSDVAEPDPASETSPSEYAAHLAWRKAMAVAATAAGGLILAADTVCAVGAQILNKPLDRADAERMIRLQEGHDTDVITGLCLYRAGRDEWIGAVETQRRPVQAAERRRADGLSRLEPVGGKVGRLRRAGPRPVRRRSSGAASPTSSACPWSGWHSC